MVFVCAIAIFGFTNIHSQTSTTTIDLERVCGELDLQKINLYKSSKKSPHTGKELQGISIDQARKYSNSIGYLTWDENSIDDYKILVDRIREALGELPFCTGFIAKNNGILKLYTAGHCFINKSVELLANIRNTTIDDPKIYKAYAQDIAQNAVRFVLTDRDSNEILDFALDELGALDNSTGPGGNDIVDFASFILSKKSIKEVTNIGKITPLHFNTNMLSKEFQGTIIQNYFGKKMIDIGEVFKSQSSNKLTYKIDTEKGSSGSPIFDTSGSVVGVHLRGECTQLNNNNGFNIGIAISSIKDKL